MRAQDDYNFKSFDRELKEFCSRYHAYAKEGQPVRRVDPRRSTATNFYDLYVHTYEAPTVELTISEQDLSDLMRELAEVNTLEYNEFVRYNKILGQGFMNDLQTYKYRQSREEQIRNQNPGVKKAWENYQLMLKLAGE